VALISLIICLTRDIGLWFVLFNILSGGLLFGAVLMATDPVTSPIGRVGQIVGGIFLGISTMIFRYLTPLPEGVLVSILLFNILTIIINYITIKFYNNKVVKISSLVVMTILVIAASIMISNKVITKPLDDTFSIISKEKVGSSTIYKVSGRGYAGKNSIKLKITFTGDSISNMEIIKSNETYIDMIYNNDYLDRIVNNQNNLDNLDTISGCTYTSKYLKEMVEKTKEDYYRK